MVVILPVHGMGEANLDYAEPLRASLQKALGARFWHDVVFEPIFYQDVIQQHQYAVWSRMRLEGKMAWSDLRKFMLFAFSDAATLEHHSDHPDSAYVLAQAKIRATLDSALGKAGGDAKTPVVVVGHSLGCQVVSNYIWDAQQTKPAGVWLHQPLPSGEAGTLRDRFLRFRTLRLMLTTGCNIPLFVAGLNRIDPFKRPTTAFEWHNFYDKDDVLGWPLRPLSAAYRAIVKKDTEMNSGGLFQSWNPLSHNGYWTDPDFINPAAKLIKAI